MCIPRRGLKGDQKKKLEQLMQKVEILCLTFVLSKFELCCKKISSQSESALKHHDLTDTHYTVVVSACVAQTDDEEG